MKTSYELAMERLSQSAPAVKLSAEQKKALADLDSRYAAKIAEREISLSGDATKAEADGDAEKAETFRKQLTADRRKLQAELAEKKDQIRQGRSPR